MRLLLSMTKIRDETGLSARQQDLPLVFRSGRAGGYAKECCGNSKAGAFLWVVGTHDLMYRQGENYVFNKVRSTPGNTYLVVDATTVVRPRSLLPNY
jgi:hypothetical protein